MGVLKIHRIFRPVVLKIYKLNNIMCDFCKINSNTGRSNARIAYSEHEECRIAKDTWGFYVIQLRGMCTGMKNYRNSGTIKYCPFCGKELKREE